MKWFALGLGPLRSGSIGTKRAFPVPQMERELRTERVAPTTHPDSRGTGNGRGLPTALLVREHTLSAGKTARSLSQAALSHGFKRRRRAELRGSVSRRVMSGLQQPMVPTTCEQPLAMERMAAA